MAKISAGQASNRGSRSPSSIRTGKPPSRSSAATRSRIARSSTTLPGEKRSSRYMPMTSASAIGLQKSLGDGDIVGTIDVHRVAGQEAVERRAPLDEKTEKFSERRQLSRARL